MLEAKASAGQTALEPVQDSATSHWPVEGRHTVVDGSNVSAGHAPEVPVQDSATSQEPAEGRQVVVLERKTSTQLSAVPEQ